MQKIIFKGHNSPFYVTILDIFGQAYSAPAMAGITRAYLKWAPEGETPVLVDSATHAAAFDWATYASRGLLVVDVGLIDLAVGRDLAVEIVVYDAAYPEGRPIAQVDIQVVDDALGDVALADALTILTCPTGGTGGSWGSAVAVTISGGVLTLAGPGYYAVETEGGAASDDLESITGLSDGDEVILKLATAAHTITVKKGPALLMAQDFVLNTTADRLRLQRDGEDVCVELSRANGVFY